MGILKLLPTTKFGYGGKQPPLRKETAASTMHYTSSLNNNPAINRPATRLGKGGRTPSKYTDNLPG
jgi:hypothetical protein